jgi:hypothetical protein
MKVVVWGDILENDVGGGVFCVMEMNFEKREWYMLCYDIDAAGLKYVVGIAARKLGRLCQTDTPIESFRH